MSSDANSTNSVSVSDIINILDGLKKAVPSLNDEERRDLYDHLTSLEKPNPELVKYLFTGYIMHNMYNNT